jgi:hypothetical protein
MGHFRHLGSMCLCHDVGPEKATRGGEWEPIKIPHVTWPMSQTDSTHLSSNSIKTT